MVPRRGEIDEEHDEAKRKNMVSFTEYGLSVSKALKSGAEKESQSIKL
jgi:hypothetical protein